MKGLKRLPRRPKYSSEEISHWWWVPRIPEVHRSGWRKAILAGTVSSLGLTAAAGVMLVSGQHSGKIDMSAPGVAGMVDVTQAVPGPELSQLYTTSRTTVPQGTTRDQHGGLLRNTVSRGSGFQREVLREAITAHDVEQRRGSLDEVSANVRKEAAFTGAMKRSGMIDIDLKRVKAEQKRILEQKKAAEKKLGEQKKLKNDVSGQDTGEVSGKPSGSPSAAPVSALGDGTATTPMPPGSYSVGAFWGQYGMWSRWHTGQDLPAPIGTPIRAVVDGVASQDCSGCQGWAGDSALVLHHGDGSSTLYAHMSNTTVEPGEVVKAGTVIGYVGMKGRTFGPHLHFEYYPAGTTPGDVYSTDNPIGWLLGKGVHL